MTSGEVQTPTKNFFQRIRQFNKQLLDRYQPSETATLLLTAIIVGVLTGYGAVGFIWLLNQTHWLFFDVILKWLRLPLGKFAIVLIPALGSLISGPLISWFAKEAKGHGVPEVMQAIALNGGRIRPPVVVIKAVASAACIGSGGSAGREGPIVQIGSALGSVLGQLFHLSEARIRNLVACGAAAGIAAVFNAPIAGSIFALEIILGEFTTGYFGSVVVSAVTASIVSRSFLGSIPAFAVPTYNMVSSWEVLFYITLGLLAPLVAWAFVTTLYWFEDKFDAWKFPDALKPAIGGLLLGLLALLAPDSLGTGLEFIGKALEGNVPVAMMALLIFGKLFATDFTLGSGNSGGVFAPSLFMGAMLGGVFGTAVHMFLPAITASPGAYALVGMAAVFAAATHAPMTGIIIVFEMSNDYRLILPLMLATVISTLVSMAMRKETIYTLKLVRRGIQLRSGRDVDIMQGITVSEAMRPEAYTIPHSLDLTDTTAVLNKYHRRGLPVVDENDDLYGIVTIFDIERATERGVPNKTLVKEIASKNVLVAFPDETMADVMRRLSVRDVGRLPVVARENPKKVLGLIRRQDLIRAYTLALTNRAKIQHRMDQLRLRKVDNTEFVEVQITPESPSAGKTIAELAGNLPYDGVIVSLRRPSGLVEVVHGNTLIKPGDTVIAFINHASKAALFNALLGSVELPPAENTVI